MTDSDRMFALQIARLEQGEARQVWREAKLTEHSLLREYYQRRIRAHFSGVVDALLDLLREFFQLAKYSFKRVVLWWNT